MTETPTLTYEVAPFDAEASSVTVIFTAGEIVHERAVNAMLDSDGNYDAAATAERIVQVARGVAAKIACGVISTTAQELWPSDE